MNDELTISEQILVLRRELNQQLLEVANGQDTIENAEDLFKLVGELECAYLHSCEYQLTNGESAKYCLLKHLAAAYILACEVDGNPDDSGAVMDIVKKLTDNVISPCQSCDDQL